MTDQPRDPETGRFISKQARNEEDFTLERLDFARRAGLQYGTDRDVYEVAGYEKHPDFDDYWSYYDRHPIAGRIIDLPPKTTWRNGPDVTDADQEEDTEFTEAFGELVDSVSLWHRLERVDRLARIGEYAILLIGVRDGGNLAEPLQGVPEDGGVAYLSQFSQGSVHIERFNEDTDSERFGLPELYTVDLGRNNPDFQAGRVPVHWSRVIHVAEDLLEDDVKGRPALKRVLNTIFDDDKVEAASAEALWQLADKVWQLKIDPDASLDDDTRDELGEELEKIPHRLRRQLLIEGGELSTIGGDTSDPSSIFDMLATKMAAGAGIPKRVLFGSERGELASSQDERNWMGTVSERQEQYAEPFILRDLLDRLIEVGALPRPQGDDYEVVWPNLFEADESEQAEIDKTRAETVQIITKAVTQGGEQALRLAAELLPEMAEVLEEEADELRRFREEEDEASEDDLEELSPNGGGPDELELPAWLLDR